jgi:crotonobetaine/carnitine-CoA ligase
MEIDLQSMGPNDSLPTIIELIDQRAAINPDRVFLEDVEGGSATYGEARELSLQWAAALHSLGIGPQTTVSTMANSSVESTLVWLGCARLRAWEAPVHPSYRGFMLEHTVNSVGAETLIVEASFLDRVAESAPNFTTLKHVVVRESNGAPLPALPFEVSTAEELLALDAPLPPLETPQSWDLAAIIYTSGTTGPSKGVMVPWGDVAAFAVRVWPIEDLHEDDVFYNYTPSSHIGAKNIPYLNAFINGRMVIRAEFKIDKFMDDVRQYG